MSITAVVLTVIAVLSTPLGQNPGPQSMQVLMPIGTTLDECKTDALPFVQARILAAKNVAAFGISCSEVIVTSVGNA